jgi:hypothetical protein
MSFKRRIKKIEKKVVRVNSYAGPTLVVCESKEDADIKGKQIREKYGDPGPGEGPIMFIIRNRSQSENEKK